jgi:Tol biopolymer transport system component
MVLPMVGKRGHRLASAAFIAGCFLSFTAASDGSGASNGAITFVRGGDIYSIEPDGTDEMLLVPATAPNSHPAWSPDGRILAYDRDARIWVLQQDGSETAIPTCDFDHAPTWSPDGQRLALFNQSGKIGQIVVQDVDGDEREVHSSASGGDVQWSPDGTSLLFTNERYVTEDGSYSAIWTVGADGADPRALTAKENVDSDPAWSPDGSRVVFESQRDGNSEIYSMAADGSDQVRLTFHPATDKDPAWSPDGTRIAFVSERFGGADIYVMDVDGTDLVRVTASEGNESDSTWRPVSEAPGEGPTIDPPPADCTIRHKREVTLRFRGSLVAVGRVKAPGYPSCAQGDVRIEKRSDGEWRRVPGGRGDAFTDEPYRIELPDRPGRYRTRAPEIRFSFYVDRRVHVCPEVVSDVVVHRRR